eukprot:CAMPEP_0180101506 /NCGR_PEP_ID=MMETSP0985-20121206/29569_1 /TAXON_ID=483367 /ORGANISM="non described non described, Strain CCMP 2436" /LENGTH=162 /DNA_ID=CAMNT_0022037515 /DNA_START=430 /DNA_END=917 /DNA_ORIENTATION=-
MYSDSALADRVIAPDRRRAADHARLLPEECTQLVEALACTQPTARGLGQRARPRSSHRVPRRNEGGRGGALARAAWAVLAPAPTSLLRRGSSFSVYLGVVRAEACWGASEGRRHSEGGTRLAGGAALVVTAAIATARVVTAVSAVTASTCFTSNKDNDKNDK